MLEMSFFFAKDKWVEHKHIDLSVWEYSFSRQRALDKFHFIRG